MSVLVSVVTGFASGALGSIATYRFLIRPRLPATDGTDGLSIAVADSKSDWTPWARTQSARARRPLPPRVQLSRAITGSLRLVSPLPATTQVPPCGEPFA